MHHTVLFCAIVLTLWSSAHGSQSPPVTLPQALRAHLKSERLDSVTSIRGLPLGVRNALQTLFASDTLDIADPGAEFQAFPMTGSRLPLRRLAAAGCSLDHCLVYYERGGVERTWLAALFHWTPEGTRVEWGGKAPSGLKTIDTVRAAVLSGAIKGPNKVW